MLWLSWETSPHLQQCSFLDLWLSALNGVYLYLYSTMSIIILIQGLSPQSASIFPTFLNLTPQSQLVGL